MVPQCMAYEQCLYTILLIISLSWNNDLYSVGEQVCVYVFPHYMVPHCMAYEQCPYTLYCLLYSEVGILTNLLFGEKCVFICFALYGYSLYGL